MDRSFKTAVNQGKLIRMAEGLERRERTLYVRGV